MLIPDLFAFELSLVGLVVNALKSILEPTIVLLQNGVFGCQVKRVFPCKGKFEAAVSELFDTFVSIVHSESHSAVAFEFVNLHLLL